MPIAAIIGLIIFLRSRSIIPPMVSPKRPRASIPALASSLIAGPVATINSVIILTMIIGLNS